MFLKRFYLAATLLLLSGILLAACGGAAPDKVCAVLDTGKENDKGFNEFSLKGAREAAEEAGLEFAHISSQSSDDYVPNIENFVEEGCDMIVTVGFLMGDVTAAAARANPDIHFAIVDVAYSPGAGCDEDVEDCYSDEGGLSNITSLMFAEDEVGYMAGTLAACVSETGVIGSVSGLEIPPVVRFVEGYQHGARAYNPDVETLNIYIPSFDDAAAGLQAADDQINDGADVIFGVGGNTGNGALIAAAEADIPVIGVDVDQYETFPEVAESIMTSAAKNMDVATYNAVLAFAEGELAGGIQISTVENGGIGLAPYHDWESRIPDECKAAVDEAAAGLAAGSIDTGWPQ